MRKIGGGPPITHAAFRIECAAFRIEGVADFVPDYGADGAIVGRSRGKRIEERRLQNRGGKIECVLERQVYRIHRLRRHRPFLPVHWLAEARDLAAIIGQAAPPNVAKDITCLYFKAGVVVPGFRIADSDVQRRELGLGFRLSRRIHPGESFNALAKSSNQVGHHGLCLRLGFWREVPLRVDLAYGVAQKAVHDKYAALPAGTLLRRAGKYLADKSEAFVRQRFWKHSAIGLDQVEREPVLPCVERSRGHQSRLTLEGFRLPDNETALLADASFAKILGPVQAWSFSRKVGLSPCVVGCVDVFVIGQAAMDLRNGVLEFKNACRAGIRICESSEFQNCGDMALILGAQVARVLVVAEVIFTIRQLQSALQQIGGIVLRIIEARSDPESKKIRRVKVSVIERVHVGAQGFTQGARQFSLVMDGSYRFQVRAERGKAFRFDGGLV